MQQPFFYERIRGIVYLSFFLPVQSQEYLRCLLALKQVSVFAVILVFLRQLTHLFYHIFLLGTETAVFYKKIAVTVAQQLFFVL